MSLLQRAVPEEFYSMVEGFVTLIANPVEPYYFMKEFDHSKPQQEWIDKWHERMTQEKQDNEKLKKKGVWSRFKW
ncbi:hypothetical protein [Pasteurella testudinis]|uniref:hypothetical protein n=1 Tax=Pasteurella testudinis TaxID=761 RepID=UPI00405A37DE